MLNPSSDRLTRLETQMFSVQGDIEEIKTSLLGRPSWAVTFILTVLSSMVVGLAVALASLQHP